MTLIAIDPGPVATSRWLTTVGLATGSAVVVRALTERIERLLAELRLAASTDPLTGLLNRRAIEERAAHELARARRTGVAVRRAGDRRRPLQGDQRPRRPRGRRRGARRARPTLSAELREVDSVARTGGDEFAVLLPDTGMAGARATAERLAARADVEISIGSRRLRHRRPHLDELARAADAALYAAKRRRVEPQAPAAR